jgi:hypothetical protein
VAVKFDYSGVRASAQRLIDRFGANFTFTREAAGAYDPTTGSTSTTTTSYTTNIVWLEYSKDEVDETTIFRGDAKLVCDGQVEPDDTVVYQNETWRIIDTSPLNPTGSDRILTIAQARK